jgi:hypothetical protein
MYNLAGETYMAAELIITINKDGTVHIDAVGYHGQGCAQDTETFARSLGEIRQREQKPEYWETEIVQQQKLYNR